MSDELQDFQMQDRHMKDREMSEWQVAIATLLIALVIAALAWAVIDPDGVALPPTRRRVSGTRCMSGNSRSETGG